MRRRTASGSVTGSRPNTRSDPSSGSSSVLIIRISVDLPEPLAPITPKISPGLISNETSSTARYGGRRRADGGHRDGTNVLVTRSTVRAGSSTGSATGRSAVLGSVVTEGSGVVDGTGRGRRAHWRAAGTASHGEAVDLAEVGEAKHHVPDASQRPAACRPIYPEAWDA